jgi:hypothetical protein
MCNHAGWFLRSPSQTLGPARSCWCSCTNPSLPTVLVTCRCMTLWRIRQRFWPLGNDYSSRWCREQEPPPPCPGWTAWKTTMASRGRMDGLRHTTKLGRRAVVCGGRPVVRSRISMLFSIFHTFLHSILHLHAFSIRISGLCASCAACAILCLSRSYAQGGVESLKSSSPTRGIRPPRSVFGPYGSFGSFRVTSLCCETTYRFQDQNTLVLI